MDSQLKEPLKVNDVSQSSIHLFLRKGFTPQGGTRLQNRPILIFVAQHLTTKTGGGFVISESIMEDSHCRKTVSHGPGFL